MIMTRNLLVAPKLNSISLTDVLWLYKSLKPLIFDQIQISQAQISETQISETQICETQICETKISETQTFQAQICETQISTNRNMSNRCKIIISFFIGNFFCLVIVMILKIQLTIPSKIYILFWIVNKQAIQPPYVLLVQCSIKPNDPKTFSYKLSSPKKWHFL